VPFIIVDANNATTTMRVIVSVVLTVLLGGMYFMWAMEAESIVDDVQMVNSLSSTVFSSSSLSISTGLIKGGGNTNSNAHGDSKNPSDAYIFAGYYSDPNHPNCQRIVQVAGYVAAISGTDGNPGCPSDGSGDAWTVDGQIETVEQSLVLTVDFSPKGGPASLWGTYTDGGIQWEDDNKWTKIAPLEVFIKDK
jgi:hypothetical protein